MWGANMDWMCLVSSAAELELAHVCVIIECHFLCMLPYSKNERSLFLSGARLSNWA